MSQKEDKMRIYNSREWRELRAAKLTANPLCEMCLAEGIVTATRCIHHKIPIESARNYEDMRALAFRYDNLQSLCFAHHSEVHQAMRSRSKEGHKASNAASLERFKASHPAPTRSVFDQTPRGIDFVEPPSDSQIHLPLGESRGKNLKI